MCVAVWPSSYSSRWGLTRPISECPGLSPSSLSHASILLMHTCRATSDGTSHGLPATVWENRTAFQAPDLCLPETGHDLHLKTEPADGTCSLLFPRVCVYISLFLPQKKEIIKKKKPLCLHNKILSGITALMRESQRSSYQFPFPLSTVCFRCW